MTTRLPPQAVAVGPVRRLWLITFVDLVMLLLAFFVLMFSMSSLDRERFGAVARAYAAAFSPLGGVEDVAVGPPRLPPVERTPGDDLAYLETVLKTAFARQPALASIRFRLTTQYLMLELSPDMPAGDMQDPDATAQRQVFELGGVLSNLPNRVAVVAAAGPDATDWASAARRAGAIRAALLQAGYPRPIAALVRGAADDGAAVTVLLMPETDPS